MLVAHGVSLGGCNVAEGNGDWLSVMKHEQKGDLFLVRLDEIED